MAKALMRNDLTGKRFGKLTVLYVDKELVTAKCIGFANVTVVILNQYNLLH